mmetsp:Transcript_2889/g.6227  ORF Transcript_2889/g.6227 Transcript_2889/m.6227 type:complete len:176 (-) Transcript_2889:145-672(-)
MPFLPSPCSIHPGTSKPVIYRVLLNENGIAKRVPRGASELSQEKLQRCIYHMSFQYSTATKAVRLPPVIGYSKKAADSLMMYVNNLRGTRDWIPGVNNEPVLIQYLPPEGEDHDEQNNEEVDEREGFFMRREMHNLQANADNELPSAYLCQLLPGFGPFKENGDWTVPFHHHASA